MDPNQVTTTWYSSSGLANQGLWSSNSQVEHMAVQLGTLYWHGHGWIWPALATPPRGTHTPEAVHRNAAQYNKDNFHPLKQEKVSCEQGIIAQYQLGADKLRD